MNSNIYNQEKGQNYPINNQRSNQNNFNDNNNPINNHEENSNDIERMNILLENNKNVNQDKIGFFKFLIYSTKAEIYINSFKSLLFWVSLCEIFLYILSVLLFFSSPKTFYLFWAFTTHLIRGIIGLLALFRIPDSYMSVENMERYDSSSIQSLQRDFLNDFLQNLQENEPRIKPLLITYFIFTIINIILDNIIFFYLLVEWDNQEYSLANIFGLIIIVVFFRNNKFIKYFF
jgi:hypothetical protein